MRSLIRVARTIWCAFSRRCQIGDVEGDPLMVTLRIHERAALRAADESRERQHYIEDELTSRLGQEWRHAQYD